MSSPCSKLPFNNQPPSGTPANVMHRPMAQKVVSGWVFGQISLRPRMILNVAGPEGALLKFQNLLICKHNWHKENTKPPKDHGSLPLTGTLRRKPIITSLKENNSKRNKHLDELEKGICTCEIEVKEEPLGNSLNFAHVVLKLDLLTIRQKKTPLHLSLHSHFTSQFSPLFCSF